MSTVRRLDKYIEVELGWTEFDTAARDAAAEFYMSRKAGKHHRAGVAKRKNEIWTQAIEGRLGEIAVALAYNVYYSSRFNACGKPDVGRVQVKLRLDHSYELRVRRNDRDDVPYMLVTRDMIDEVPVYRIHGWITGKDAKQSEWIKDPGNAGEPNFFVPQDALRRPDELPPEELIPE